MSPEEIQAARRAVAEALLREEFNAWKRGEQRAQQLEREEWERVQAGLRERVRRGEWDASPLFGEYLTNLCRRYGLSYNAYVDMYTSQDGKCKLCSKATRLVIDHDHTTGRVRGLLCNACNSGLGKLGDTARSLQRAQAYLQGAY